MSKYDRKFIDAIATCDGDIYFNCQSYTIIAEESNCQSCNSTSIIVNHLENNNIPSYNALLKGYNAKFFTKEISIDASPLRILLDIKGVKRRIKIDEDCHITSDDYNIYVNKCCFYIVNKASDMIFFYNPTSNSSQNIVPQTLIIYEDFVFNYDKNKIFINKDSILCEIYLKNYQDVIFYHMNYIFNGNKIKTHYDSYHGCQYINIKMKEDVIKTYVTKELISSTYFSDEIEVNHIENIRDKNNLLEEINQQIANCIDKYSKKLNNTVEQIDDDSKELLINLQTIYDQYYYDVAINC